MALSGAQPYASWKELEGDAVIAPYHKPGKIHVLVVGGETSPLWKISDLDHTTTASIDKWRVQQSKGRRSEQGAGNEDARGAYESPEN
jgi:hypothetical protein